jgi:hypothetical protein
MNTEESLVHALRAKAAAVPHTPMPPLAGAVRRGWLVPAAAAAVVALAIGGAVVVLNSGKAVTAAGPSSAAGPTTAAPSPGELAPGEVYYSLRLTGVGGPGGAIMETQLWQPRDRAGEWRQQVVTGRSIKDGRVVPSGGTTAPPGGVCYPAFKATDPSCTAPGSWFNPTVDFLATAPRDPATIGEQFHAEAVAELQRGNQSTDLAYLLELRYLGLLLTANGVSADLASALRQVIAAIPGIGVAQNVATLTGTRGTAYSLPKPTGDPLTLIFNADNHFLGSPTEVIHHGIAPALGQPPSRMLD